MDPKTEDVNSDHSPADAAMKPEDDYGGMSLDEWIEGTRRHLKEHYGEVPADLVPVGEPGW